MFVCLSRFLPSPQCPPRAFWGEKVLFWGERCFFGGFEPCPQPSTCSEHFWGENGAFFGEKLLFGVPDAVSLGLGAGAQLCAPPLGPPLPLPLVLQGTEQQGGEGGGAAAPSSPQP